MGDESLIGTLLARIAVLEDELAELKAECAWTAGQPTETLVAP